VSGTGLDTPDKGMSAPRIALIHATALAVDPVVSAFGQHWPEARLMNLLDDSLSVDRAADGRLTEAMTRRFVDLAGYAKGTGATGILFTCSAFGPAIEAAGAAVGLPTLKPNEAMFVDALTRGARLALHEDRPARIGLIATFRASIDSMAGELEAMAAARGQRIEIESLFVPDAMDALARGEADVHHQAIAEGAAALAGCDVITLAQFSMAAAQPLAQSAVDAAARRLAGAATPTLPAVLSSPVCAVLALKEILDHVRDPVR
jgi:hypothetical protein